MNYVVDVIKLTVSIICTAVCFGLAYVVSFLNVWLISILFLALGVVYIGVAIHCGRIVHMDGEGVKCSILFKRRAMAWTDVSEVGVLGTKALHSGEARHTGARYIYFSPSKLDDDQRFQLCLHWPPKDLIYFRFSYKRIAGVQRFWAKDIAMYNVGELHF
ncbi:MAG: hypothetical protein LIO60_00175 [Oscillospiraceae bacterium]|nr:hypothetical protein [Oscillospiraceae bacterium]